MSTDSTFVSLDPEVVNTVTHLGVVLLSSPFDIALHDQMLAHGVACLRLIARGDDPPKDWSPLEDWVRVPADPHEVIARATALSHRVRAQEHEEVTLEDRMVVFGDVRVVLTPLETRLLQRLLRAPGAIVSREVLISSVWLNGLPSSGSSLNTLIKRLRHHLDLCPITIHTVKGTGHYVTLNR